MKRILPLPKRTSLPTIWNQEYDRWRWHLKIHWFLWMFLSLTGRLYLWTHGVFTLGAWIHFSGILSVPSLLLLRFFRLTRFYFAIFYTYVLPQSPMMLNCRNSIDFTICNPPFYSSAEELITSAALKSRPPHSACTGAEIEMVTPGGEVSFVGRIIEESCNLKGRVQWYSIMLGKFSSIG